MANSSSLMEKGSIQFLALACVPRILFVTWTPDLTSWSRKAEKVHGVSRIVSHAREVSFNWFPVLFFAVVWGALIFG